MNLGSSRNSDSSSGHHAPRQHQLPRVDHDRSCARGHMKICQHLARGTNGKSISCWRVARLIARGQMQTYQLLASGARFHALDKPGDASAWVPRS